jgi:hypothetical protein
MRTQYSLGRSNEGGYRITTHGNLHRVNGSPQRLHQHLIRTRPGFLKTANNNGRSTLLLKDCSFHVGLVVAIGGT